MISSDSNRKRDVNISFRALQMHLEAAAAELEWLVLATPTGKKREELTAGNIHLTEARDHIFQAALTDEGKV